MLISTAFADAASAPAPASAPDNFMSFGFLILMAVALYFMIIRPQARRAKEHKTMLEALSKGDEVVTNGGVAGKVTSIGDSFIKVEIANNTEIALQKQAIATVLPKGTLKDI